jgi:Fe-S-cluster-containing hydrogenase component 2
VTQTPLHSLFHGHWFKLICGASFQHLPEIRNLVLAYTLAGADCIDISADPAVLAAAQSGLRAARLIQQQSAQGVMPDPPLIMVSLSDGEDPHFRKAEFDPQRCPADCPRPCMSICPAAAIAFTEQQQGVLADRCYGCGRCLPVCPIQQITTRAHAASLETILPLIAAGQIDAIEIHTQVGREQAFQKLWQAIAPYQQHLQLLAVSCPDGEGLIDYLGSIWQRLAALDCPLIWQTDGRPMSGDIGDGTTRATIKLGQKVLFANLPGYVQLAGGTNRHTIAKLRAMGLLNPQFMHPLTTQPQRYIAGIAYGSFARSLLSPLQAQIPAPSYRLEDAPELLRRAVGLAAGLVSPLKQNLNDSLWLTPFLDSGIRLRTI